MTDLSRSFVERRFRPIFDLIDRWVPEKYEPATRLGILDIVLASALGAVAAAIAVYAFWLFDPLLYSDPEGYNVWFESDAPRVVGALIDAGSKYHVRNEVHPIFSLVSLPIFAGLTALGLSTLAAGAAMMAGSGFLAVAFLYLALRGLGLPRMIGVLFTGAFLASAAYVHWFSIVETFALGAATICFTLFVLTSVRSSRWLVWGLASVATLAITTTNWMIWLTAGFFRLDLRKLIYIAVISVLIVVGLSIVQKAYMPSARLFFVPQSFTKEVRWVRAGREGWRPDRNLRSALISSAVAPSPMEGIHFGKNAVLTPIVNNQASPISSYTPQGFVAIACWLVMLGAGIFGGIANIKRRAVFLGAGSFVAAQFALHAIYGEVTFLYAAHFFPAMILIASFSWFTRARYIAVAAAAVFIVAGGWANLIAFQEAVQLTNEIVTR